MSKRAMAMATRLAHRRTEDKRAQRQPEKGNASKKQVYSCSATVFSFIFIGKYGPGRCWGSSPHTLDADMCQAIDILIIMVQLGDMI